MLLAADVLIAQSSLVAASRTSAACRYLEMAHHELQAAQSLIHDKAERHAKEVEEKKSGMAGVL